VLQYILYERSQESSSFFLPWPLYFSTRKECFISDSLHSKCVGVVAAIVQHAHWGALRHGVNSLAEEELAGA
jgi:hypothetical protein